MAASGQVTISIVGETSRLRNALSSAEGDLSSFQTRVMAVGEKMKSFGRTMTLGVTLPIVGGLALATKAAADEQAEIAKLDQVLKNSTVITNEQRKAVEKQVTAWQNATGIADGQLRPALSNLIVAGLDWKRAQDLMGTAMDIATAKGLPLEAVTKALARAYNGNTTSLSRLGIATKDAEGKALSFDEIMQNAAATMGGSAARNAKTAAGQMQILKARFQDLAEQIGGILIPFLQALVEKLAGVTEWFSNLSPTMQKLAVGFLLLLAAVGPLAYILGSVMTIVAALSSPVLVIVLAIGALIAVTALLYLKWDEVWSWMRDHPAIAAIIILMTSAISVPILLLVGVLRLMRGHWDEVWNAILAVTSAVWSVIGPVFDGLDAVIRSIIVAVVWVGNAAADGFAAFQNAVSAMWNVVDGPLGWLLDRLENIKDAAQWVANHVPNVSGIGGPSLNEQLQSQGVGRRAAGGPVGAGMPYVVGENGPELFVPANTGTIIPNGGNRGGAASGFGSTVIQLVVSGRVLAEVTAAELNRAGGPRLSQNAIA